MKPAMTNWAATPNPWRHLSRSAVSTNRRHIVQDCAILAFGRAELLRKKGSQDVGVPDLSEMTGI